MRGKVPPRHCCFMNSRITPAYAGKSAGKKHRTSWKGDHPRLCGEKFHFFLPDKSGTGSPPPMRGKAPATLTTRFFVGITPAYAGKRRIEDVGAAYRRDHPRLCGEKAGNRRAFFCVVGSPPPMRGKVEGTKCVKIDQKDHPRLCGEKFQKNRRSPCYKGSPPPMRGKERKLNYDRF